MSSYTPSTDFSAKDTLPTGDSNKIIRGSDFDDEFDAIQTAVNSKADASGATLTGSATAVNLTVSGTLNASGTLQVGGVAVTSTAAELNILDGVTATTAELNYVDGVTSNIQTQLDAKQATITNTDDVSEGSTNLYYTTARANTAIDARVDQAFVEALNADAESVDGYDIVVDSGSPSGTDANTIYFVT